MVCMIDVPTRTNLSTPRVLRSRVRDGSPAPITTPCLSPRVTARVAASPTLAGLNALTSDDALTQAGGVVGLLYSANAMASLLTTGSATQGGFLNASSVELLGQANALLSIANLARLDDMLHNGQIGSAAASLIGAINGAGLLTGASSAMAGVHIGKFGVMTYAPTTPKRRSALSCHRRRAGSSLSCNRRTSLNRMQH